MNLAVERKKPLLSRIIEKIQSKKDVFSFEESNIGIGESLWGSLNKIAKQAGGIKGYNLIIIDPYFTAIPCGEAKNYIEQLKKFIDENQIKHITIYTEPRHNCFEDAVSEIAELKRLKTRIHDRYWIFEKDNERIGLHVGISINGFGKKFSTVSTLEAEDTNEIYDIIINNKHKTVFNPPKILKRI